MTSNWPVVAAIWYALGIASHLVVRFLLPYADPVLLPLVWTVTGLGLAMIHRIDLIPDPARNDARTQLGWVLLGVLCLAVLAFLVRDHRMLARFPYLLFIAGLVLLLLPIVPGLGRGEIKAKYLGQRKGFGKARFDNQPGDRVAVVNSHFDGAGAAQRPAHHEQGAGIAVGSEPLLESKKNSAAVRQKGAGHRYAIAPAVPTIIGDKKIHPLPGVVRTDLVVIGNGFSIAVKKHQGRRGWRVGEQTAAQIDPVGDLDIDIDRTGWNWFTWCFHRMIQHLSYFR